MSAATIRLKGVIKRFGGEAALDDITAAIRPGRITGLVGPDGAGKSTLLRLVAGLMVPTAGRITVGGRDSVTEAQAIQAAIGYMPQRFGLYEDLSVQENLDLYAALRGVDPAGRAATFDRLLSFTGLGPFRRRLAGRLSGGMKQKLGLACALMRTPRVLLLDEPGVGVDPISRRELWRMVRGLVADDVTVVWSTAYLDEAERCDEVLLLDRGRLLFTGEPAAFGRRVEGRVLLARATDQGPRPLLRRLSVASAVLDATVQGSAVRLVLEAGAGPAAIDAGPGVTCLPVAPRFEDAYVAALGGGPKGASPLAASSRSYPDDGATVIEARGLTRRFGDFVAAADIGFSIGRGEVFGLLGPNGAGKSTTFRMLCGLLVPSAGEGRVAGHDLRRAATAVRARLGYMAQTFSLYGDLGVRQNLAFFAGAYGLGRARARERIATLLDTLDLARFADTQAKELPLGFKQRLALACAVLHEPEVLFLDEPTAGVDPISRREFWSHIDGFVARGVTVLVTTHFMDEAEYCDRVALIYRGRAIAEGAPDVLKARVATPERPDPSFEDAFIALIEAADAAEADRAEGRAA